MVLSVFGRNTALTDFVKTLNKDSNENTKYSKNRQTNYTLNYDYTDINYC